MTARLRRLLLRNLFDFEKQETPGERIFYRLFEGFLVFWTIRYAWRWGQYIPRIEEVVLPLGLANYLDVSFLFGPVLPLVNAVLISALVVAGFLRIGQFSYLGALLLFHVQYVARFSLGKTAHGSNFVGMALLAVAAATLAFRQKRHVRRTALGLTYFFFGLGYTTAACSKLVATGPGWVDGRHLWMWIHERTVDTFSMTGQPGLHWLQELTLQHHGLATAILLSGLLTEFFGFTMWFKRFRPYIMTLLLGMHAGILLVMEISFSSNTYLLVLLAYPWAALIDTGLHRLGAAPKEKARRLSTRFS